MSDAVNKYMNKIKAILEKSQDPLVHEYPERFIEEISNKAMENWLEHGEPELSFDEINEIRQYIWDTVEKIDIDAPVLVWNSKLLGDKVVLHMN